MPTLGEGYIRAYSKTGYDRRYEDKVFPAGTRCIEMVDYVGTGDQPGDFFGVYYCRSESFYRCFANASFNGPCIVEIGEVPADQYDDQGEPITDQRINMAAAFRNSDIEILPHGCSRGLIENTNSMFEGCRFLRSWTPQEMVEAGLAGVKDPAAPRILRSNGIAESAFLLNLAPQTMRRMFAGCEMYSGRNINSISWANLKDERAAADFAIGCQFAPHYLDAIIAWLHRQLFVLGTLRTPLLSVNLGSGTVSGNTAAMARQLIDAGIELRGFDIV
jgi:hypothetical protein